MQLDSMNKLHCKIPKHLNRELMLFKQITSQSFQFSHNPHEKKLAHDVLQVNGNQQVLLYCSSIRWMSLIRSRYQVGEQKRVGCKLWDRKCTLLKRKTFDCCFSEKMRFTNKWVFWWKDFFDQIGQQYIKFEARISTWGFQLIHEIDYEEKFLSAVKFFTLKPVLAIVVFQNHGFHQLNVKIALWAAACLKVFSAAAKAFVNFNMPNYTCKTSERSSSSQRNIAAVALKNWQFLCKEIQFKICAYEPSSYLW